MPGMAKFLLALAACLRLVAYVHADPVNPDPNRQLYLDFSTRAGYENCQTYVYGQQYGRDVFLGQDMTWQPVAAAPGPPQSLENMAHAQARIALPPGELSSGRIYFGCDTKPLDFKIVIDAIGASKITPPLYGNAGDDSYDDRFNFVEFTRTVDGAMVIDISAVDIMARPALGFKFEGGENALEVKGPSDGVFDGMCNDLEAQSNADGQPWGDLCVEFDGRVNRILSPGEYLKGHPDAFKDYFTEHVKQVYMHWYTKPRTFGDITCVGSPDGMSANCNGMPIYLPTAGDVFGCASGPFAAGGNEALRPPLCAAFNRGSAMDGIVDVAAPQNHFARAFHKNKIDGLGYAFPFDDVNRDDGRGDGTVTDYTANCLRISVGGSD